MSSEKELKESLRNWILTKNQKIAAAQLADDTAILESRIISSLQIMDLILELEKLSGRAIEVEQLKPGVFASINSIYENFLKD